MNHRFIEVRPKHMAYSSPQECILERFLQGLPTNLLTNKLKFYNDYPPNQTRVLIMTILYTKHEISYKANPEPDESFYTRGNSRTKWIFNR